MLVDVPNWSSSKPFLAASTHTVHWSNKKINDRHKRNHFNGRANNIKTDIDKNNIVEMLKPLRWLSWTHAFNQLFITHTPSQCIIYIYTHPSTHLTNGFTDDLYNDFCFYFIFSFSSVFCSEFFCCNPKHILIYCAKNIACLTVFHLTNLHAQKRRMAIFKLKLQKIVQSKWTRIVISYDPNNRTKQMT